MCMKSILIIIIFFWLYLALFKIKKWENYNLGYNKCFEEQEFFDREYCRVQLLRRISHAKSVGVRRVVLVVGTICVNVWGGKDLGFWIESRPVQSDHEVQRCNTVEGEN